MATKTKLKLALVGSESLRGREFKEVLARSDWNPIDLEFYDPDVQEEFSRLTDFRDEPRVVHAARPEDLAGKDLVFLAGNRDASLKLGRQAAKLKFRAIDLSEAFTDDPAVPLIVAGVNDHLLAGKKPRLVANPHPVTVILSHLFHLVLPAYGLAKAVSFVLQPVSAFDDAGIQELASQSAALLSGTDPEKKIFKEQIAFNILSHTEKPDEHGFCTAELQMGAEVRRVLERPDLPLFLSAIQAPVFHTYSLMTYLELEKDTDLAGLEALFTGQPHFTVTPFREGCSASSLSVAGKSEIFVGQLKQEVSSARSFWVWLVADNLTRGSALNALDIARKLLRTKGR
jgi:aspartate-semialdehyde dehydrogenase